MKNLAIINTIISNSYDNTCLNVLNSMLHQHNDINASVFTTAFNINMPTKKFNILPIYEARYCGGICIVWDLISLELVLGFPNLQKIVYLHDNTIPWRKGQNISYAIWDKLFLNDKTQILISDSQIAEIFKLTFGIGKSISSLDPEVIYEEL